MIIKGEILDIKTAIQEKSHKLLEILILTTPARVALSSMRGMLAPTKKLANPVHFLTSKLVEKRYQVPSKGFEHFYSDPNSGSLVVSVIQEKSRKVLLRTKTQRSYIFGHTSTLGSKLQGLVCKIQLPQLGEDRCLPVKVPTQEQNSRAVERS